MSEEKLLNIFVVSLRDDQLESHVAEMDEITINDTRVYAKYLLNLKENNFLVSQLLCQ